MFYMADLANSKHTSLISLQLHASSIRYHSYTHKHAYMHVSIYSFQTLLTLKINPPNPSRTTSISLRTVSLSSSAIFNASCKFLNRSSCSLSLVPMPGRTEIRYSICCSLRIRSRASSRWSSRCCWDVDCLSTASACACSVGESGASLLLLLGLLLVVVVVVVLLLGSSSGEWCVVMYLIEA